MANEGQLPFIGNLTADPELKHLPGGSTVCNFTVAVTPKVWDKNEGKHVDGQTVFWPCSVWRDFAENCAATLKKGMRVTGVGLVKEKPWEDKEGKKRSTKELDIESIGPDLRFAQAQVRRSEGGGDRQGDRGARGPQNAPQGGGYGSFGGGGDDFKPAYRSSPQQDQGGSWPTTQPGGSGDYDPWQS